MSQRILIVKNITREGPGLLETIIQEQGLDYDLVDLHQGEVFPSPEEYGAVVVLGGPDSANDTTEKMQMELQRIWETVELGLPYLGICLGLQTLVKACGGSVVKNPVREIGFRDPEGNPFTIQLTEAGRPDPLFTGLEEVLRVFHLHGETVEITPEMELLGTGKFCKNQIVRVGERAYGLQCHFELTPTMFQTWLQEDDDLRQLDRKMLEADFANIREEYTQTGRTLLENFLRIAKLL